MTGWSRVLALVCLVGVTACGAEDRKVSASDASCKLQFWGAYRSASGDGQLEINEHGVVFSNRIATRRMTTAEHYRLSATQARTAVDLDVHRQVVSLYPRAFDDIRFPACVMVVMKADYVLTLAPVGGAILLVEVSATDPPVVERFVAGN